MQYFNVKRGRRENKLETSALSEPYNQVTVHCYFKFQPYTFSLVNSPFSLNIRLHMQGKLIIYLTKK